MTAPAAITAQLVDVRNVAAHKSVRLELHVPAEQAGLVMAAFGWPTMADPIPVALARLVEPKQEPAPPKERRAFAELPYAQQAAMRCSEPAFLEFLARTHAGRWEAACRRHGQVDQIAAEVVRSVCGVSSRAEIVKGSSAGRCWELIEGEFFAQSRGMR